MTSPALSSEPSQRSRPDEVPLLVPSSACGWFKVPTPLGTYNPDWAVLVETDVGERLYFVVETKSSAFLVW